MRNACPQSIFASFSYGDPVALCKHTQNVNATSSSSRAQSAFFSDSKSSQKPHTRFLSHAALIMYWAYWVIYDVLMHAYTQHPENSYKVFWVKEYTEHTHFHEIINYTFINLIVSNFKLINALLKVYRQIVYRLFLIYFFLIFKFNNISPYWLIVQLKTLIKKWQQTFSILKFWMIIWNFPFFYDESFVALTFRTHIQK